MKSVMIKACAMLRLPMLFSLFLCGSASADILNVLNNARRSCAGGHSVGKLNMQSALTSAARQVAQGVRPNEAAHSAGYEMTQLASIHLEGFHDDSELRELLLQRSCKLLSDPDAKELGYYQRGTAVWILIGASRGNPGNQDSASKRALLLVNKARSQARRCGWQTFAATTPLTLNEHLAHAAQVHSDDMAQHRYMDHTGRDGSTPATRVTEAGYKWKIVGENVAAGAGTADVVVNDWLGSPGHCANIMNPKFTEMGLAFAINKDDQEFGVYWTQTFGAPKAAK